MQLSMLIVKVLIIIVHLPIGAFSYVPEITISGSEIYAYRGTTGNASYADYIGQGGKSSGYQGGQIQGTIKKYYRA